MPPRLGGPASAPQSPGGLPRGQADSVTPAARPAFRRARRLTPLACWACTRRVSIDSSLENAPLPLRHSLRLPIQPQGGGAAAEIPLGVGGIVLHIRVPGAGDAHAIQVHVVLLLRNIALDIEDNLLARLAVLGAPLFLEHGRDLGVVDMAAVARLVGGIQAIQHAIRLPGITDGTKGHALKLTDERRG